jgi:hypothetical protein
MKRGLNTDKKTQPNEGSQKIAKGAKLDALTLASFAPFLFKILARKTRNAGKQSKEEWEDE